VAAAEGSAARLGAHLVFADEPGFLLTPTIAKPQRFFLLVADSFRDSWTRSIETDIPILSSLIIISSGSRSLNSE
jgi:hypothetical protein